MKKNTCFVAKIPMYSMCGHLYSSKIVVMATNIGLLKICPKI
jgi:hypothetical protein